MNINKITQRLQNAEDLIKSARNDRKKYRKDMLASFGQYIMNHYPIYEKHYKSFGEPRTDRSGNTKYYQKKYYTVNDFKKYYKITTKPNQIKMINKIKSNKKASSNSKS